MKGWIAMKVTAKSINNQTSDRQTSDRQTSRQGRTPSPKYKKPNDKKPNDRKSTTWRDRLIICVIIVIAVVGVVFVKITFFPTVDTPIVEEKEKPKDNVTDKNDKPVEGTSDVAEEAKQGLERPDDVVSAEDSADAKSRLQEGLDYVISLGAGTFIPTRCAAWQNTLPEKALQVQQALDLGYVMDVENSQWFGSNAEQNNVYQFVVKMHKDGEEDIAFSGNYLKGTRAINISVMTGDIDITSSLSPGDEPQANDLGTD